MNVQRFVFYSQAWAVPAGSQSDHQWALTEPQGTGGHFQSSGKVRGGHFLAYTYVSEGHFLGLRFVRGGHFQGSGICENKSVSELKYVCYKAGFRGSGKWDEPFSIARGDAWHKQTFYSTVVLSNVIYHCFSDDVKRQGDSAPPRENECREVNWHY